MSAAAEDESGTSPIYNQVVALINETQIEKVTSKRIENLKQIQELIIHRDPTLLDNFLDEVLAFQSDSSVDVRQFLLTFIEAACKQDPEFMSKTIANVALLLSDQNVNVQKRVIHAVEQLYPIALSWVSKSRTVVDVMENTWDYFAQLKERIFALTDSENDGVRTRAIKFMEACIMAESCRTSESDTVENDTMSLDLIPRDHRFLSYRKLEADGRTIFQKLVGLCTSQHISGINLITCINALSRIGRTRPDFYDKVVVAFETVQVNLPPTLAKTQVTSVRKELKKHLMLLLKHPRSPDFATQITTLLIDLGATPQQVAKFIHGENGEGRKRRAAPPESVAAKRAKEEDDYDDAQETFSYEKKRISAIDITAEYLTQKMTVSNVADIVLLSMVMLPDTMPAQFQSSYTPIAQAGTDAQVRHLARLMATQLTAMGLGPGADKMHLERIQTDEGEATTSTDEKQKIIPVIDSAGSTASASAGSHKEAAPERKSSVLLPSGIQGAKASKRIQQFGLAHIAKPMANDQLLAMSVSAFERLLNTEKKAIQGGAFAAYMKTLTAMVAQFNLPGMQDRFMKFIFADQKLRGDMAILWVYYEYACYQGYNNSLLQDPEKGLEKYNDCLTRLLGALYARGDHKESLFHRLLLEAPLVTPAALNILKKACEDTVYGQFSMNALKQMASLRPRQRAEFMSTLLDFTTYEDPDIRKLSLSKAEEMFMDLVTKGDVLSYITMQLHYLLNATPPNVLFGPNFGRPVNPGKWEENAIKACLYLCLHLLPRDHMLIHELAPVYVATTGDVKRVILRQLELPVKAMGMNSPELLQLVETCPKGAETLVTRIVHLLTERHAPTKELVNRIRDLYHKRVPDVRFLIPVLTGLNKKEIVSALPKLIKLNTNVVKEVFNRLLHGQVLETNPMPLSAQELLIALHQFDFSAAEMKAVMNAINLLLGERQIYTQETLAGVIQQLIDQNPLPTLLMRTVLQALGIYPRLIGFVMNVLQRLIMKQVWKQATVWEGFIKCCQKTKPQSFQVLLQLPPPQLKSVFAKCPDLREPLLQHINGLSAHQQAHIPPSIMKVLQTDPAEYSEPKQFEQESQDVGAVSPVLATDAEEVTQEYGSPGVSQEADSSTAAEDDG